jgi:hypothetical protein
MQMKVESRRLGSTKKLRVKRKKEKNNKAFARSNEQKS